MKGDSRHQRVYRWLLRLYPAVFRARFSDELVQLFGDLMRDARAGPTPSGAARIWLQTLWDLALTAPSEHRSERAVAHSLSAPPTIANRMLGLLGIVGGALLLAPFLPSFTFEGDLNTIRLLLFCLGAMAIIVGVTRRQVSVAPRLAWLAAVPAFAANAWYLVMIVLSIGRPVFPEADPGFRQIFGLAAFALWLTDAAFGLVGLRIGVVSRSGALALAVGSFMVFGLNQLGLTSAANAPIFGPIALVGIALNGTGWVLLGLDVATRRRPSAAQPG